MEISSPPAVERGEPVGEWSEARLLRALAPGVELALPELGAWAGAEPEELALLHGVPAEAALRLAAALELGRRALRAGPCQDDPLRGGEAVYLRLRPRLAHLPTEHFFALYLDAKGRVLHERGVSHGTLTSSLVHPREVFAPALLHRAAALVVAHNHPSGDPEPSAEDRAATRRLHRAGRLLGVELLDHVVIARSGFVSFLERGWL